MNFITLIVVIAALIALVLLALIIANAVRKSSRKKFYKKYKEIVSNLNYLRQSTNENWFDRFAQIELEFWECEFMKLFN